jgi:hypothetical protein
MSTPMPREEEKRSKNDYFGQLHSMDGVGDKVGERGAGSTSVIRYWYRPVKGDRYMFGHEKRAPMKHPHIFGRSS